MNKKQLSEHIGNIDDRLVQQAEFRDRTGTCTGNDEVGSCICTCHVFDEIRYIQIRDGRNPWITYSFARCGIDPCYYANREIGEDEILPWSVTSTGVKDEYLLKERHTAKKGEITPDCRRQCTLCGASELYTGGGCDE